MADLRIIDIEASTRTAMTPDRAYTRLIEQFDAWWVAPLRSSRCQAAQVQHRVGGSVIEDHGSAAGRCLGTIRELHFGESVVVDGLFGLADTFSGSVEMRVAPADDGTLITVRQQAIGTASEAAVAERREAWQTALAAFDGVALAGRGAEPTPRPAG